ncbi:MAG: hypothetical protein Q7U60_08710, partial [Candidatus Methanoperedens sp.]|nr:hypothetical protein [Candidatus Methanoperedens sp.]
QSISQVSGLQGLFDFLNTTKWNKTDNINSTIQISRSQVTGQEGVDTSQNTSISALQANDTSDRSFVNLTFIKIANATTCSGTDKSKWNGTAFICEADNTVAGVTNETINPYNMNGSNISTGTIPTARYLAAVNASALLASIAQVTGLQTIISSLQGNDTAHDSSISALQANDTADRAYLNNTFPGSTVITTLGTIANGIWQGTGITAAYITSVNGSNITSGIIPTARYLAAVNSSAQVSRGQVTGQTGVDDSQNSSIATKTTLAEVNASANLSNINAANITSGQIPSVLRLPAGTLILIDANETNSSEITVSAITSSETTLMTFNLPSNSYKTIIVEAEVDARITGTTIDYVTFTWRFNESTNIREEFIWTLFAPDNVAGFQGRNSATLKTSFAGGQGVTTTLNFTGRVSASSTTTSSFQAKSFRVYGVVGP